MLLLLLFFFSHWSKTIPKLSKSYKTKFFSASTHWHRFRLSLRSYGQTLHTRVWSYSELALLKQSLCSNPLPRKEQFVCTSRPWKEALPDLFLSVFKNSNILIALNYEVQSNDSVLVNVRRIYTMLIFFSQLDCPFLHSWILMILERSINWCHSSLTCSLLRLRFDIFLLGVVVSSRALPSSPSAIIDNHQSLTVSWETRWWQRAPNFNMADGPAEKEETILPASKLESEKKVVRL